MVNAEIAKNADVSNEVLVEKARAIDGSVKRLSPRQFHATYRLPALRAARKSAGGTRSAAKSASKRATKGASKAGTPSPAAAAAPASTPAATPAPSAAAAPAKRRGRPPRAAQTAAPTSSAPTSAASSREREAVRQVLDAVVRQAITSEDRASFVQLFASLDDRTDAILAIVGRR